MPRRNQYIETNDPGFLPGLNEELSDLHRTLDDLKDSSLSRVTLEDVQITTTETIFRHTLSVIPKKIEVRLHADARWFMPKKMTDTEVCLQSNVLVTADIVLEG